ncbi:hypothetical protein CCS01_06290 [Rhodopila globiformis]|uniref:Uncharacterized protein n=1 Tax=Rhodopila globiformis TaxID=1071 RepID=A0A2S6NL10_RHOGL|nr:hypothetical protein CCS01_06290 [Rhodopila globiformis]
MARLVRATYSSTCAATGGPDKPGHDERETQRRTVSEMCASRRDEPGHDDEDRGASVFQLTCGLL